MYNCNVEEVILTMADIVRENKMLRAENKRLLKVESEYHQSIQDRCRASEEALNAAINGITIGKMIKN